MQNVRGTKTLKVIIYYAIMETRTIYVDNKKLRYIECENEKNVQNLIFYFVLYKLLKSATAAAAADNFLT